ncbi:hypothetical protein, conserved [Eimeria maxima]|uniref:Uncharacterized protein n=1 Tax=Eimeria maxima TaxID=5804 RepID=U6LYH7_EIMMA|nr:hypothetical protein, conserved [Eimeria maxima]CDJ55923.1 hypothetical protein, conserved [Eimeria maxima]
MTFVVPVIATKAANAYKTIFFQRQKGHKKSKLPIFCILAVTAFSISSARDVNGFTILDASLTGAGGGAANDPQQPYPLLQDRLRKALTEKYHENAESIFVSEGVNTREEEESNDSDDIDEAMPPLSTTVDKFDEAMNRACSPSIKNSLFDNLGQPVTEAVNLMDRWMNSVLGAMTTLESDSTPLYEYLSGTGSLTAVIKGSCLFGLSILAVLMYQKKGVQGAKQAYCQAYAFTDELLRGSPSLGTNVTQVDEPQSDEFEGLLPLIESVESLALLVDGDNPNNIVELSKKAATNALDVVPMAGEMTRATKYLSDACASLSAKTSLSGSFHKSVWCDIRKRESGSSGLISTEEKMSTSAQKIIQINPKKYVETIFSKVTLPALNIEATLPTENVKELFFTVFDILGDTEETISKVLGWLDAALSVDCAIYLAILLLVVLWAAWFFFRGSKTNGLIPALFWNVLTWVAVALLVVGGALGWITTLGKQGCSILINNCLEQDNWDLLSDYVPVVEPLISQCLTKEGDGDLLAGVGLDAAYDQMLKALQETLAGFPTNISSLDKETSGVDPPWLVYP